MTSDSPASSDNRRPKSSTSVKLEKAKKVLLVEFGGDALNGRVLELKTNKRLWLRIK